MKTYTTHPLTLIYVYLCTYTQIYLDRATQNASPMIKKH